MEFLSSEDVLTRVAELVRATRGSVRIAVAYVGRDASNILELRQGDVIVVNGSDNAVGAGATDPHAIEDWLNAGVRVVNHPWLHAKVFVAGRTAIVGSANLSQRAQSGGIIEAAIRTTQRETVAAARKFVDELIRDGGQDIDHDWVEDAKRRFPKRRATPPFDDSKPPMTGPFRLWIGWWNDDREWTKAEERAYDEAVTEFAPAFRPRARYQPEGRPEDEPGADPFRHGDMVVMLGARNALLVEFHNHRPVGQGRSRSMMALYRRDTRLVSVTNAAVRRALESIGSTLPAEEPPHYGRWLEDPDERKAVLNLWNLGDPGAA